MAAGLRGEDLDLFRLPKDKAIPKLSKGMRTQLMLLLAMSRGVELLIMDEPTSGLDPGGDRRGTAGPCGFGG